MTPGVSMADPNIAYWQATADKARNEAKDNLRLVAEKNIEIAELRKELKDAKEEIFRLRSRPFECDDEDIYLHDDMDEDDIFPEVSDVDPN
jgi:hypothetical protein